MARPVIVRAKQRKIYAERSRERSETTARRMASPSAAATGGTVCN